MTDLPGMSSGVNTAELDRFEESGSLQRRVCEPSVRPAISRRDAACWRSVFGLTGPPVALPSSSVAGQSKANSATETGEAPGAEGESAEIGPSEAPTISSN